MKKSLFAATLAGVMLLVGCSGVSQESYNSVVAENEALKSENSSLKAENSASESETPEYCMPKDHVKRITKVLGLSEEYCVNHEDPRVLDMKQYNIKSICEIWAYNNNNNAQIKCLCNISTDNTPQEKAAFITYFWRLHMGEYLEKEVENGCENVVTVINDNKGVPIAVWLVYGGNGDYKHDMDIVDTKVLAAVDEVLANADTWKPKEDQISQPFPDSNDSNADINSIPTSQPEQSSSSSAPVQSEPTNTATAGERNALKKAQSYLDFTAFSRNGLIGQLEFEGFTKSEATYGADNVGANWNEQAVAKAKSYLEFTAFSYSGLVEQLEFEEFTHEQAVYGADKCGADWNEQAAKKAESYLDLMAFSRDSLIEQLEFEGFTHDQAVYGAAQNGY